jgi:hypothetical protein
VATTTRNLSNIYVLNEIGKEKCYIGKEYEVCLWQKRMGHINFNRLSRSAKRK